MVIDASVWVSLLVPQDVHHDISRRWFETIFANGERTIVPALLLGEVAGAIARRTGEPSLAQTAINMIMQLPGLRVVSVDRRLGLAAAELAGNLRLQGTDAVYVALARELGLPLITWDNEQTNRVQELIAVDTPHVNSPGETNEPIVTTAAADSLPASDVPGPEN